jgi:asparagine synthase (glutamine-hydrolysing)
MGFSVPLAAWFRADMRHVPADVLLDPVALDRGYFRRSAIEKLIAEHQSGRSDHSSRLFALLQLEYWHREVVDSPATLRSPRDMDAIAL